MHNHLQFTPNLNTGLACCLMCWSWLFQVYLICTIMLWLYDGISICTPIDHATLNMGHIKFHEISLEFRWWAARWQSMAIHNAVAKHSLTNRECPYTVVLPCHRRECHQRIIQDLIVIDTMSVMTGIFPMAQTQEPTLFVPSAWAPMHTMSMHATHPRLGMDTTQRLSRETRTNYTCKKTILWSAWIGNECKVAPATSTTTDIFALVAVKPLTESWKCLLPTIQTFGSINYKKQDSQENICMLWQTFVLVFSSVFPRSLPPRHPQ